ncbi:winged helix-turn-helix transcriptional regulator [Clostridium tunisiense]|uniref:winged helix-turn-helix transcriptional regulator n=1 Tax=Clostridium tunisiense TaxID=219748 RepID=UPI0002EB1284|nr:winged helix-turn-helix transcriptional regulator [Clostridium tunisiense]
MMESMILQLISNNNYISQKSIAQSLGISVGKVNYLIKDLAKQGLITIVKNGNKHNYNLSDVGMKYLEKHLNSNQNRKIDLGKSHSKIELAVILLAGRKQELGESVGLININNEPLVKRTIRLLKNKGIKKFILICGYNKEKYNFLLQEEDTIIIENDSYEKTGTMYSLSLAKDYIDKDFILLEGDIVFEERLLDVLYSNNYNNSVTITNLSSRDDEVYVEVKDDYIYKISKDIHQLNKIHGEIIGITKISKVVFEKMLARFGSGTNPYVNYEYMLLDVAETFKVHYEYIPDIIFAEIDNLKQYYYVKNNIEPLLI